MEKKDRSRQGWRGLAIDWRESETGAFRKTSLQRYCAVSELPTDENTLLALEPIKRIVPTTITRMTANITAYSAISWPRSSAQSCCKNSLTGCPPGRSRSSITLGGPYISGVENWPSGLSKLLNIHADNNSASTECPMARRC